MKNTELPQKNYLLLLSVLGLSVITFVFVFFLSFYFFDKCKTQSNDGALAGIKAETQDISEKQADNVVVSTENSDIASVIKKVSRHVFLPNGNVTVTTVRDPESLRKSNPVFYQLVKEGDRVLIYSDRAILYNQSLDIVLDVAHFSPTNTQ